MFTTDDTLFSVLHSCSDGLEASRLTYYMYIYQLAGLDYNFRYKLRASGVESRGVDSLLNILVTSGKVKVINGRIELTNLGELYYAETPLTFAEWEHIDNIKNALDRLSDVDLYFIVITDMLVSNELKLRGVSGLIKERQKIKSTISGLSTAYSDENFDNALKLIRYVKEGFSNDL